MTEDADSDYVLGTHDAEVERLGLQNRVWRPRALDAWRRAGFTIGQYLIDVGAGPGYATLDLAEVVGPDGLVCAVERSARYTDLIRKRAAERGFENVDVHCLDLTADLLPVGDGEADGAWCRWIFAFVRQPALLLSEIARALRPGAVLVIHEYLDYRTWRLAPRSQLLERFVAEVMASWRDAGGEPDIALDLPEWLTQSGFEIRDLRPIIDVVPATNFVWEWPASFIDTNLNRLMELGRIAPALADEIRGDFQERALQSSTLMITPTVLEIIAARR